VSATAIDDRYLPLYEAKMIHHFDHRWATYDGADTRELSEAEKHDPNRLALPRYWVAKGEISRQLPPWNHSWLLGFRDIARSTDERTVIFTVLPRGPVGHTAPLLFDDARPGQHCSLLAALNSFALDYIARQKIGGTHLTYGYLMQFAVPEPTQLDSAAQSFLVPRVVELGWTAVDLAGFAADLGYTGQPFRWDPDRRALIRAELDAVMFRLYGIERDDVGYIMETFPIVRRRDGELYGEYRTKRLILERYDALAESEALGVPYRTPLDPPPGDRCAAPEGAIFGSQFLDTSGRPA
jgi:hypothetical protein